MTNNEYAASLRQIADFYDANPDMPKAYGPYVFAYDRETFLRAVKCMARGGKVTKSADDAGDDYPKFRATRKFGEFELKAEIDRHHVCRLVRHAVYECPESLLSEAAEYEEV